MYWMPITTPKMICPMNRPMAAMKYGLATACDWYLRVGMFAMMNVLLGINPRCSAATFQC